MSRESPEIRGDRIAVLGFGREGKTTLRYLLKYFPEKSVAVFDRNDQHPELPASVQYFGGEDYLSTLDSFDTVIRSPGISLRTSGLTPALQAGCYFTSATNIFLSEISGRT